MTTRNVFIFIGTFVAGALVALVVRAAMYQPHDAHTVQPSEHGEHAAMVSNPLTPAAPRQSNTVANSPAASMNPSAGQSHTHHEAASTEAAASGKPVNTVCAICGMKVDPKLEMLEYQGKTIGFGCKLCAPKFKADPERYGPLYLKNEVSKP
jgi:YHS domain-containing protein